MLRTRISLSFLINPFYLYCIAFSIAIAVYLLGWSSLFPKLSAGLIIFTIASFLIFITAGLYFEKNHLKFENLWPQNHFSKDITFVAIVFLGVLNVLYMGYLPIADNTHNYREFGMPVVDPLFNTLSIFFAVLILHSYLDTHKRKYLFYFLTILILQVILYRRSTIIWILMSSSFLYILYIKKIRLIIIVGCILVLPILSYCFGFYGNARSNLSESFVINDLEASPKFKKSGLSYNHYMTYLYLSSPLANLQENIDKRNASFKKEDIKEFLFYCLIPESITLRLEKPMHLLQPECYLISPNLIVGSFYMVAFYIMGWGGMIIMFFSLLVFILLSLFIIRKFNTMAMEAYSILSAFSCLLIFSNFMNRMDIILLLFVYPVVFHYLTLPRKIIHQQ